ncbi:D-alanyl-D-alanine carboxypeptidase family protein [Acidihalobacter aeolianus]|nr:D-alanyl-D-alanine carboxypeptidase family protein [Acidihalobacter aeolianus]
MPRIRLIYSVLMTLLTLAAMPFAHAATPPNTALDLLIPPAPHLHTGGYALLDASNSQVLAAQHPDRTVSPAASTKLMLAYLVFDELTTGQVSPTTRLPVSTTAWHTPGSSMFLKPGTQVSIAHLLDGLITDGGNDAAVCLAQGVAGTQSAALSLMNQTAQRLGLRRTHYASVDGLTAAGARTTPLDAAKLGQAVVSRFPQYLGYFRHRTMRWNGITQISFDRLLERDPAALGLTVGDGAQGYGIVAAARQHGTTLVAAVMDTPADGRSVAGAFAHVASQAYALLSWGFDNFDAHTLYQRNEPLRQIHIHGTAARVPIGAQHTLRVLVPRGCYDDLHIRLLLDKHLHAPIQNGVQVGEVSVALRGKILAQTPVIALHTVARENGLQRLAAELGHWL